MRRCIVHVGFPKTGTTSIQSSLLFGLRDPRFRFLTLDSDFGNLLVSSAFRIDFGEPRQLFSRDITSGWAAATGARSRRYLDRSLRAAARDGVTPILSAESIVSFKEASSTQFRDFLVDRGWTPQVIAYVRPPIDFLTSLFGQGVLANLWFTQPSGLVHLRDHHDPVAIVRNLDRTFGVDAVSLHRFEPTEFPDRCVVRHFCAEAGIDFRAVDVVRENDSLDLAAIRFLHAMIRAGRGRGSGLVSQLRWRVLVERLRDLSGPPLRLHATLTDPMVERLRPDWEWLESRLGRPLPMSSRSTVPDEGIRSEADLLDFSQESLEWLARTTGRTVVRAGRREETAREAVEQLRTLGIARSPGIAVGLVRKIGRERWRRSVRKFLNQR